MKITLIIFTFLGICDCYGQKPLLADSAYSKIEAIEKKELNQGTTVYKAAVKPSMQLYPNPARHKVEINISGFATGYVQVQLINGLGLLVKSYSRRVFSGNEVIVCMFSEEPGIYLISLKQGNVHLKSQLLIQ